MGSVGGVGGVGSEMSKWLPKTSLHGYSRFPIPDSRFPFPSWEGLGVGSDSRFPTPDSLFLYSLTSQAKGTSFGNFN
ncbi:MULTISPECIES: hypothetical protein [Moorena]|uniref:hypothetical protein n=1 Tax=Moorena TaxID=1155738 RepID=UPI0012B65DAE|nr:MULTISPECIES: hypothetical protein [Moorena]NEP34263.1 hypothetical protein [Moorena sp. SIO3B2]NEQ07025.1 hypothetical protein [Moorena sp. SIO4E2]NER91834.1 hypothetical protein [Moorena sp. SIO3A2]NET69087.1 hypothetical protein [Moorena sp. SIO1G6]